MRKLRSARLTGAALFTVASLGACVSPKNPGVGITNLRSDIVFGVKAVLDSAAPAALSEDIPTSEQASADTELPPSAFAPSKGAANTTDSDNGGREATFTPQTTTPRPRATAPTPVKRECPDAALNAFPDKATSANLPENVLPLMGEYRFKKAGTITRKTLPFPLQVEGFEKRIFRNLKVLAKTTGGTKSPTNPDGYGAKFTYEVVQPKIDGTGTITTTYQVLTNGRGGEVSITNPTGNNINYRDPEAGLTIKKIERRDRDGVLDGSFEPAEGLLLMPLGVRPGERFQAATVDPRTGQTYQLSGQILEPARVDACGVITEGWLVESDLAISGAEGGTTKLKYIVSTNLGGILISENVDTTTADGSNKLTYSIGQLAPDQPAA